MMCMVKMESVVFGQYLRQLSFSILFMAVCFAAGVGSTTSLPAIIFMLGMFSLSNGASNYDEHNGWAAFRLTMPLSRRDVVVGRYAFVLMGSVAVSALIAAIVCALGALESAVEMPAMLADVLRITPEGLQTGAFTFVFCGVMGTLIAAVSMPVFFRFGQTKATQWLPFIMMFLGVAPFMLAGFLGEEAVAALQSALAFAETGEGLAVLAAGAAVFATVCYAASALVSVRLYVSRDL